MPRNKTGIFMGTTEVEAQRTVGQILSQLVKAGATSVNIDYEEGKIAGIRWVMPINGHNAGFHMQAAEVFFAFHVPAGEERTLFQIALDSQFKTLLAPKAQ
jgi:hypothetical protein